MTSHGGRPTHGARSLLCWAVCFSLLWCSSPAAAQLPPVSGSSSSSIETVLTRLTSNSKQLAMQLEKQKISYEQAEKQVSELLQELAEVRIWLEESLKRLDNSEAEVQRLTVLLQLSDETLSSLRTSFGEFRRAVRAEILRAAVIAFLIGLVAGGAAGVIFE